MNVGYIVGSLSQASINRRLAEYVVARAPQGISPHEIKIDGLPLYHYDLDDAFPPVAVDLKRQIHDCDALLFITPEYNRSITAPLKNALDWGSRPWGDNIWQGKTAGIIGTGLNPAGTAVAQSHLRSVLVYLGVTVVGTPEVCLPWAAGVLQQTATGERVDAFWDSFTNAIRQD